MVATDVLLLVQVPPVVESESVIAEPTQVVELPLIPATVTDGTIVTGNNARVTPQLPVTE
jgi:hypothetical protein